jgi:hypothetical protein
MNAYYVVALWLSSMDFALLVALLAFGQVFGFLGVLLALLASAAQPVGLRCPRAGYLARPLYGKG